MLKVSVICITYNQENFIRQTLDSFLMQKTNFPFEVIIHDDKSTDRTAEIIEEYTRKSPKIIKPIYESENQYSKGNYEFINDMLRSAKGKYIAYCEGDDYWTDPEKLQIQVDFMEKHPDYAICFHPVRVFYEKDEEPEYIYPETKDTTKFNVKELLQHNFIQTNSVMYRRQKYEDMPNGIMPGDLYLHLYHAKFGKIGFIDRVMSDYRRHPGGVWWESGNGQDEIWKKYAVPHLSLFIALHKLYGDQPEYAAIINVAITNMFNKLIDLDKKYGKDLLRQATRDNTQIAAELIARQSQELQDKTAELYHKDQEIVRLQQAGSDMEHQIALKDHKIRAMQASRVWKARNKIAKLRGREQI